MDFIEKIFGFSPDSGSGSLEVILFLIPVAILAAWFLVKRSRQF